MAYSAWHAGIFPAVADMRKAPWYRALYEKKTDKTRRRDMSQLKETGWLVLDAKEILLPGFVEN